MPEAYTSDVLAPDGVAHATRISPCSEYATLMIDGDGANAAGFPGPIRPGHDLMAFVSQHPTDLSGQATLDAQFIRQVFVRFERAGIAIAGKAWRFNGRL